MPKNEQAGSSEPYVRTTGTKSVFPSFRQLRLALLALLQLLDLGSAQHARGID